MNKCINFLNDFVVIEMILLFIKVNVLARNEEVYILRLALTITGALT